MSFYDKECLDRYGIKTCLLIENKPGDFELRVLDCPVYKTIYVKRKSLCEIIPKMIGNKYTVVVIENCLNDVKEITAVHMPLQPFLNAPPIIQ